ncbi:PREDICTED: putative vitellogenin receptor [Rhagoletis zephyria]|uniref:putative vitellogenin receptor n=1 Tax=Rhagoletis zephyria TaxID=28612 RepID=UPI00081124A1|nr:PREDICTED: putative vitellogenin receptor [Rhagoletis zephyria]
MGAVCSCFPGYRLDVDQRTCIDVNECEESEPCAQLCENTHGSYRCKCYPDFMLRPDKTTCKSIESQSTLMFSTYNEVRSMTEQPITLRVAWSVNDSKIAGFDLNVHKRMAYFSTDVEDVLYKVDMDKGEVKSGLWVQTPTKVAVDWITDNVYVITRAGQYGIKVCSFEARMCGLIVQANPRETIRALAVDALSRRLFYATVRAQSFNEPITEINMAHLDGKKHVTLLLKRGGYITALACDPYKRELYFVDMHTKTLQVFDYRPSSSGVPRTIIQKGNVVMHPSGLTIYENQAFIVNIGSKEAVHCQLFGAHTCKAFNLNILNAEDVVVDGATRQPHATNPCDMAKCHGMCVQADYGYECMCGDAFVGENVRCPKEATNEILSSALLNDEGYSDHHESTPHAAVTIILILLLLAMLCTGVGYLYYRRVSQGHRDFNINLHFQNPLSAFTSVGVGGGKFAGSMQQQSGISSTTASFDGDTHSNGGSGGTEKKQYISPIYRFLRNSRNDSFSGAEILLEASAPPDETDGLATSQRAARSALVETESFYTAADTIRVSHDDDDGARAKHVA